MKIAIFHNFMDNIGGAEYVDLVLARELNADIYTTNVDKEKIRKMGFSTDNIYSIGKIPLNAPFRQEMAYWKFRRLNLKRKYDLYLIAGDWAMSGAVHNKPNIWYIYSPTREIWDLYKYTRNNTVPFSMRLLFDIWVSLRRIINLYDSKKVDKMIAISQNVRNRVRRYLGIEAEIIYPPTDTNQYFYKKNGDYWLSVNRIIAHKRIELQMKAFSKLPNEKLIIVGSYEKNVRQFEAYKNFIERIKPENVQIINWVDHHELKRLYSECKGFITTAKDEDFGMTPVEAMASGKPVIASNEGGYKETVINGKTGILIDEINTDKLVEAIKLIGKNPEKYKKECLKQAKNFDTSVFIRKIKEKIDEKLYRR